MSRVIQKSVGKPVRGLGINLRRDFPTLTIDSTIAESVWLARLALACVLVIGVGIRLYNLNLYGFNTDEAVYAGQAAGILNNEALKPFFPVFRAHPLLFQFLLALIYSVTGVSDHVARYVSVFVGAMTLIVVYVTGRSLYNRWVGVLAALFMALMPYHVIVTRQVLLDGPMTLFSTLTLCAMTRFGLTQATRWLYVAGLCMGLTFLAKETGIIFIGSIYLFLALSPRLKVRLPHLILSLVVMIAIAAIFPLAISLSGAARTGQNYLLWQLLRRPNHDWSFYLTLVPVMIGVLLIAAAIAGIVLLREQRSWRETLLVAWILVPFAFFQVWPVKGFQYLLPIAPAIAILAARGLVNLSSSQIRIGAFTPSATWFRTMAATAIALTLALPTWTMLRPQAPSGELAGLGGLPGGREVGLWLQQNTPKGTEVMTVGPSIANPIQFYGNRKANMLSISTNPLSRNPAYEAIDNPDLRLRNSEIQYIVWDRYSATRSPHFAERLMNYVKRFKGKIIHTEQLDGQDVVIVYEVHP